MWPLNFLPAVELFCKIKTKLRNSLQRFVLLLILFADVLFLFTLFDFYFDKHLFVTYNFLCNEVKPLQVLFISFSKVITALNYLV